MNTLMTRFMGPFAGPSKAELCDEIERLQDELKLQKHVTNTFKVDLQKSLIREADAERRMLRMAEDQAIRENSRLLPIARAVTKTACAEVSQEVIETREYPYKRLALRVDLTTREFRTMDKKVKMPDELVSQIMRRSSLDLADALYKDLMDFFYYNLGEE